MRFLYFGNLHPFSQLLLLAFVGVASMLFFFLLSSVLAVPLFGVPFGSLQPDMENIPYLKFSQAFQSVGMFVAPAFAAAWLFSDTETNRISSYLNLRKDLNLKTFGRVTLVLLASIPLIGVLGKYNAALNLPESFNALETSLKTMEDAARKITEMFLITDSSVAFAVNLLIVALIPAVGEELFFRGTVQRIFLSWFKNPHIAILVASAVFSFIHFQFYGFVPRMVLGMVFGYMFFWYKNIWYPIIAHFLNNAIGVTAYFYYDELKNSTFGGQFDSTDTTVSLNELAFAMLCAAVVVALLLRLRKVHALSEDENPKIEASI